MEIIFNKVFISDPNFRYTQYFTFENFLLTFCILLTVIAIFIIIPDIFRDENL